MFNCSCIHQLFNALKPLWLKYEDTYLHGPGHISLLRSEENANWIWNDVVVTLTLMVGCQGGHLFGMIPLKSRSTPRERERESAIWSLFYLSSCIRAGEPDKSYFSMSWVNLNFSRSSIFFNNFICGEAWLWHLLWWSAGLPGRTSGHLLLLMLLEFPSRKV